MTQPIPTAEEIVQVFIDKGWRKSTGSTTKDGIRKNCACAVPALIVLAGEDPLEVPNVDPEGSYDHEGLYTRAGQLYGMSSIDMFCPFDTPKDYASWNFDTSRGDRMMLACRDASLMLDQNPNTCEQE